MDHIHSAYQTADAAGLEVRLNCLAADATAVNAE